RALHGPGCALCLSWRTAKAVLRHIELDDRNYLVFFFQAEDGIRDSSVTGVQTCALPIYDHKIERCHTNKFMPMKQTTAAAICGRSEERRVGKECRCRCGPSHKKKKADRRKARECLRHER